MFEQSKMKRKEDLDNLDIDIGFHFDQLFINGTYRVEVKFPIFLGISVDQKFLIPSFLFLDNIYSQTLNLC